MARKVKLDILENHEDRIDEPSVDIGQSPPSAGASDVRRPPGLWMGKKWIVTGAVLVSLCLVIAGTAFFMMRAGKKDIVSTPVGQPSVAVNRNIANFDTFVIDCRDGGGNVRIVMFAFAAELNRPANGDALENRVELRGAIYALSKKRSVASLLSPEERKGFRKEIAAELERRLGAGVVKAVYFTKFQVL